MTTVVATCRDCDASPDFICDDCLAVEIAKAPPLPDSAVALLRATGLPRYLPTRATDAAA